MPGRDVLPQSLTELYFGSDFSQLIGKDVLPKSLKVLCFVRDFNDSMIRDVLPSSLKKLIIGARTIELTKPN
jgi:hypothetical protein